MNKVILSDKREIEVKPAKVGMVSNAQKMYKEEFEREMYIVSQCSSLGMDEVEDLELSDYQKLVAAAFKLGK